jgi:hypothetical protein
MLIQSTNFTFDTNDIVANKLLQMVRLWLHGKSAINRATDDSLPVPKIIF